MLRFHPVPSKQTDSSQLGSATFGIFIAFFKNREESNLLLTFFKREETRALKVAALVAWGEEGGGGTPYDAIYTDRSRELLGFCRGCTERSRMIIFKKHVNIYTIYSFEIV